MCRVYLRKEYATLWDINSDKILLTANGSTARIVIMFPFINKELPDNLFVNTANNRYHKNKLDTEVIIMVWNFIMM